MNRNAALLREVIRPAWSRLVPYGIRTRPAAENLLLAIGYQESAMTWRRQFGGPALGLWQFERNGVMGVVRHTATRSIVERLFPNRTVAELHAQLEHDDTAAAILARLLLWTDPHPVTADPRSGWETYLRVWRPGKPRVAHWRPSWAAGADLMASVADINLHQSRQPALDTESA
jgi:hypothetical protein